MSETQNSGLQRPAVADGPAAAGAMLRQAREAAGVHLASLAMSLKVPAGRLEALETGRIDLLPDPTFARALAASMCRSLRIDAEPVLQLLPRTSASPTAAELAAAKTAFRGNQQAGVRSRSGGLSRPVGIVVVLLLLATAVLIFAPDFGWELPGRAGRDAAGTTRSADATRGGGAGAGSMTTEPSVTGNALRRPAPEPAVAARPASSAALAVASAASAAAALPAAPLAVSSAPASAPVATASTGPAQAPRQAVSAAGATTTTAAATAVPPPASAQATGEPTLLFETAAPAWIQVVDATGTALLKRTVPAGETVRLNSDALPLKVTVGHSDKTKVRVRGEPFDLDPVSKGGVARFQVKQ